MAVPTAAGREPVTTERTEGDLKSGGKKWKKAIKKNGEEKDGVISKDISFKDSWLACLVRELT